MLIVLQNTAFFLQVDLTNDRVPVFSAAHPGDKYLFSREVTLLSKFS